MGIIYFAPGEKTALKQLDTVTEKWQASYPRVMDRWRDNWDVISPIFKFSIDVRKAFYTTNMIESLNSSYHRLIRQRSIFPSPQSLLKALCISTFEITKKWTVGIRNWGKIRNEMEIMYPNRLTD